MGIPKWAHLPPNSKRLDFCGCCREGLTREKSAFTEENGPKMVPNSTFQIYLLLEKWPKKDINGFVASF